jgi:hypothetical protein|tara:strand:- start:24 stop:311 length:288 start_codon:yes stop_codon:yes gene_type:complete
MDNIRDENLKRLGKFIAEELIRLAKNTDTEDWIEENMRDHTIGELARCVTLQNLYLDREEFEKCAIMKIRIMELADRLGISVSTDLTNLEDEDEI